MMGKICLPCRPWDIEREEDRHPHLRYKKQDLTPFLVTTIACLETKFSPFLDVTIARKKPAVILSCTFDVRRCRCMVSLVETNTTMAIHDPNEVNR